MEGAPHCRAILKEEDIQASSSTVVSHCGLRQACPGRWPSFAIGRPPPNAPILSQSSCILDSLAGRLPSTKCSKRTTPIETPCRMISLHRHAPTHWKGSRETWGVARPLYMETLDGRSNSRSRHIPTYRAIDCRGAGSIQRNAHTALERRLMSVGG